MSSPTTSDHVCNEIDTIYNMIHESSSIETFELINDTFINTKEEVDVLLRARNEELKELQSKVDSSFLRAKELEDEYNSIIEHSQMYKKVASQQDELYNAEMELEQELNNDIKALEKELTELEQEHDMEVDPNPNQLLIALYRGLGLEAKVEEQKVDKMIMTSSTLDMRTVSLRTNTMDYTTNYIWDFVSS